MIHKTVERVTLGVVIALTGMMAGVPPATANHPHAGEQTHTGVPFQGDPHPCAYYSNYRAVVEFPGGVNNPADDFVATIESPPQADPGTPIEPPAGSNWWQEGPSGTFGPNSSCTSLEGIGDSSGEPKFKVRIVRPNGSTCETGFDATYTRVWTDITITNFSCTTGITTVNSLHYEILACDRPIAPSSCTLGDAD